MKPALLKLTDLTIAIQRVLYGRCFHEIQRDFFLR